MIGETTMKVKQLFQAFSPIQASIVLLILFSCFESTYAGKREVCRDRRLFVGKPVNLESGNVYATSEDLRVVTGGIPFVFSRTYASDPHSEHNHSRVGLHWRHSYQNYMVVDTTTNLYRFMLFGGKHVEFSLDNGSYKPKEGSGGYTLKKDPTEWIVENPLGTKYYYSDSIRRIVKQVDRNGNSLELQYVTGPHDTSGTPRQVLVAVIPRLSDNTHLDKILWFSYNLGVNGQPIQLKSIDIGPPHTGTSNCVGGCSTGYCWSNDLTNNPPRRRCATRILGFKYYSNGTLEKVFYKRDDNDKTKMDETRDYVSYVYLENQGRHLLTEAKDGNGKIIEKHTYNLNNSKAQDSIGSDGTYQFTYNGSDTQVCIPASYNQAQACYNVEFNTDSNMATKITGDTYSTEAQYSSESNLPNDVQCTGPHNSVANQVTSNGYILPKYRLIGPYFGPNSATLNTADNIINFFYTFSTRGLASRKITYRDVKPRASGCLPISPDNRFSMTEYYHPKYPGLIIAGERDSVYQGKGYIVYDYDLPGQSQCQQNISNCSRQDFNQDPKALVRRVIKVGYTGDITSNTQTTINWVKQTQVTELQYDNRNRLISAKNPSTNHETQITYYPGGQGNNSYMKHKFRVKKHSTNQWLETTFEDYDLFGNPQKITQPDGSIIKLVYNSVGKVVERHQDQRLSDSSPPGINDWAVWTFKYTKAGRLEEKKSPEGHRYIYSYDDYGRLERVSFQGANDSVAEGFIEYEYNNAGKISKVRNLRQYDTSGNYLIKEYKYSFSSLNIVLQDDHIPVQTMLINNIRRLEVTPPLPKTRKRTFDYLRDGRPLTLDGMSFRYNLEHGPYRIRQTSSLVDNPVTNSSGIRKSNITYNKYGKISTISDTNGKITTYTSDDFGRIIEKSVIPNSQGLIVPTNIHHYSYDTKGRIIRVLKPYNSNIQTIRRMIEFEYDTLNRLTKIKYPSPSGAYNPGNLLTNNDVTYVYDETSVSSFSLGKLTTVTTKLYKESNNDVSRTTKYEYNAAGLVVKKHDIVDVQGTTSTLSTSYSYNKDGRRKQLTYPVVPVKYSYEYNDFGQLTKLKEIILGTEKDVIRNAYARQGGPLILTEYVSGDVAVAKRSRTSSTTGGKVLVQTPSQTTGRLLRIGTGYSGSPETLNNLQDYIITLNSDGKIKTATDVSLSPPQTVLNITRSQTRGELHTVTDSRSLQTQNYIYNFHGDRSKSPSLFDWQGDGSGNLFTLNSGANIWQHWYRDGLNELTQRKNLNTNQIQYYSNGSAGERVEGPHRVYYYHTNDRIAIVEPKLPWSQYQYNKTVLFAYDHMGRRVRKLILDNNKNITGISLYFYDLDGRLLQEYSIPNVSNSEVTVRTWKWAGVLAGMELLKLDSSGSMIAHNRFHYISNYMNSPTHVVDEQGRRVWISKHTPFGKGEGIQLNLDSPDKAYTELSATYERINYPNLDNHIIQNVAPSLKKKRYAVQFFFDKLNLETEFDFLYYGTGLGDLTDRNVLHSFTGNHHTGLDDNPASQGFWGPVIWVDPTKTQFNNSSSTNSEFQLQSDGSVTYDGYKISKYRSWRVASGENRHHTNNFSLPESLPTDASGKYLPNTKWQRSYNVPSAKWLRVCFSSFELESSYDRVEIRNAQHHIVQVLTGNKGEICSGWVSSTTIQILMYSDGSVEASGFTIARIESMHGVNIQASFPGHWKEHDTAIKNESGEILYAGLHYNWNRFYDPEVGRYTRQDPFGLFAGQNSYVYANNDPFHFVDQDGLNPALYVGYVIAKPIIYWTARRIAITAALAGLGMITSTTTLTGDTRGPLPHPLNPEDYDLDTEPDCPPKKDDDGFKYFFHGTHKKYVRSVLNRIKPVSVNTDNHPLGSFFTFENDEPHAFFAAHEMAYRHYRRNAAILYGRLPTSVYNQLFALGYVHKHLPKGFPRFFPNQTVFWPEALPTLNIHWQWLAWWNFNPDMKITDALE